MKRWSSPLASGFVLCLACAGVGSAPEEGVFHVLQVHSASLPFLYASRVSRVIAAVDYYSISSATRPRICL